MGILEDLRGPALGFLGSVLAFVLVAIGGLYDVLATFGEPGGTLVSALTVAVPYLLGLVLVGLLGVGFLGWGLYRFVSGIVDEQNELVRNERVARAVRTVEDYSDLVREIELADRIEPSAAEKRRRERERVTAAYVDGSLSEAELERELERILETYSDDPGTDAVGVTVEFEGDGPTRETSRRRKPNRRREPE